ncbi:pkd2 [Symbiodinium sp. KB8]|nr:pkd2 [Symbiodinium sp. KB8]
MQPSHSAPVPAGRVAKGKEFAVPQKVYLKWLRQQMDVERACLELPFTIALLCIFGAFAIIGLSQDRIYRVQHAIHEDIAANANFAFSRYQGHKNYEDVHGIEDFWSWLRLGYLPLVVQPVWSYSEGRDIAVASVFDLSAGPVSEPNQTWRLNAFGSGSQPLPISGDYLRYNRMVGGLRLRQGVSSGSKASCRFPGAGQRSAWERWYGKSCKPNYQEVIYSPEPADGQTFHDPVRVEWFLPEMDGLDHIYSKVLDMQDGCSQMAAKNRSECLCNSCQSSTPALPWLREDTNRVEVGMVTYNANEGIVTHTGVNFWFTRGGRVLKRIETMSIWVDASRPDVSNLWTMVFGIIWTLLLLHIFCTEVKEIAIILINADTVWYMALLEEYVGFSNTVDWISLIVATVVAVFFVLLSYQSTELQVAMNVVLQSEASADREAYEESVGEFFAQCQAALEQERSSRIMLSIYPFMLMLRLLKSFDAQPRLAIITETLREAGQDMLHFGLAFCGVCICLCLQSVLIFGRDVEDLGNFGRALHFAFRIVFDEFDDKHFHELERVSRPAAYVWFTAFEVLVVIILLNMLLAIIMDNYMMVKKRARLRQSLLHQIHELWRRWRMNRRKERVQLKEIWNAFAEEAVWNRKVMCQSDRLLNSHFLVELIPGLPPSQAERTLHNSWAQHLQETEAPFAVSEAHESLADLESSTRCIRSGLYYAFDVVHYFDSRPVPGTNDLVTDTQEKAIFKLAMNEAPARCLLENTTYLYIYIHTHTYLYYIYICIDIRHLYDSAC